MKHYFFILALFGLVYLPGCQSSNTSNQTTEQPPVAQEENPAAEGFNAAGSDEKAIEIADEVMRNMGGRKAWNETRHLHWTFFGRRTLTWDKHTGDVRIDIPEQETTILMNIHSNEGKAMVGNEIISHPDSLQKLLNRGKGIWINDSYWLVMPFKLKDSGVTLTYVGADTTADGRSAEVLELRFKDVGNTPQNRYLVFVDDEQKLITQWTFFRNAEDTEPGFTTPWIEYKPHGDILLSGNRGETPRGKRELTNIAVYEELPENVYTDFAPVDWSAIKP